MYGDDEFAVFGYGPVIDPVGIVGEARDFFVFDGNFEEANGWLVIGVVNDLGIVLAFLLRLLVGGGIFLRGEDEGVFVEPVHAARIAGEFGEGIGFAAVSADQPDLPGDGVGFVGLGAGTRARTDEGDPFAVGGELGERDGVGAAGELHGAILGEAGEEEVGDAGVFFLVAIALDPEDRARVGGKREIGDGLLEDDVVDFPGRGFSRRFCVVGEERSREDCGSEKKHGNAKMSAGQASHLLSMILQQRKHSAIGAE